MNVIIKSSTLKVYMTALPPYAENSSSIFENKSSRLGWLRSHKTNIEQHIDHSTQLLDYQA